jgi:hypothetical protein
LPEMVLEKFPDREKLLVELKEPAEKLNRPIGTGFRVLLFCTRNTTALAKQGGSVNPGRVWFVCEVVVVVVVEGHPPPGVMSSELMDTVCDPAFWMVTKRVVLERAALVISTLPWVVELTLWLVETLDCWLLVVLECWLAGVRYRYPKTPAPTSKTTTIPTMAAVATPLPAIEVARSI